MAAKKAFALGAVAALSAFGCGTSGDDDDLSDGISGGSAGAGNAGAPSAGRGGTTTGGANAGGSAGNAGASASGGSGGAGSSGAGAGSSAGTSGSAGRGGAGGAADCLSPCLRELFDTCRAQTSCVRQMFPPTLREVECEVATGYRSEVNIDAAPGEPELVVTLDGQPCYTAFFEAQTWTYRGPDNSVLATATVDPAGNHGRCPELETGGVEVKYPIDTSDPRCAPVSCTPGVCP
jgi:hypothetical protein